MSQYEYAAVPAPKQVPKVKGLKGAEQRFAHGMTELLNAWAAEGWEFVRAEALGFEEKSGMFGKSGAATTTLMIFRRTLTVDPALYAEAAPTPEELAHDLPEPAAKTIAASLPETPVRQPDLPPLSARREAPVPTRPLSAPVADPTGRRRG